MKPQDPTDIKAKVAELRFQQRLLPTDSPQSREMESEIQRLLSQLPK